MRSASMRVSGYARGPKPCCARPWTSAWAARIAGAGTLAGAGQSGSSTSSPALASTSSVTKRREPGARNARQEPVDLDDLALASVQRGGLVLATDRPRRGPEALGPEGGIEIGHRFGRDEHVEVRAPARARRHDPGRVQRGALQKHERQAVGSSQNRHVPRQGQLAIGAERGQAARRNERARRRLAQLPAERLAGRAEGDARRQIETTGHVAGGCRARKLGGRQVLGAKGPKQCPADFWRRLGSGRSEANQAAFDQGARRICGPNAGSLSFRLDLVVHMLPGFGPSPDPRGVAMSRRRNESMSRWPATP